MTGLEFMHALNDIDDSFISELVSAIYPTKNKNYVNQKSGLRLLVAVAVAVSIIAALGLAAYAINSIHQRRQEELRAQYMVTEHNVTSYVEYPEEESAQGLSLLSAINDGEFQTVYVNVSPISWEEAYAGAYNHDFWCSFDGGETCHSVSIPWDNSKVKEGDMVTVLNEDTGLEFKTLSPEKWAQYMMESSYDAETQTLTLRCDIINLEIPDSDELELTLLRQIVKERVELEPGVYGYEVEPIIYGKVKFTPTKEQSRLVMFNEPVELENAGYSEQGSIVGFELSPTGIKLLFDIPGDETLFAPGGDGAKLEKQLSWGNITDGAMKNSCICFEDGSKLELGSYLSAPIENGYIACYTSLSRTVDINTVEAVEIYGEKVACNYVN